LLEFFGSMINMDPPRHTKLRLLVNKGFTPRMVARVEEMARERAASIVDRRRAARRVRLRHDIAAALPLEIICEMMGIPPRDYRRIFELHQHHSRRRRPRVRDDDPDLMNAGMSCSSTPRRSAPSACEPRATTSRRR
jgi:cytochrome P450